MEMIGCGNNNNNNNNKTGTAIELNLMTFANIQYFMWRIER